MGHREPETRWTDGVGKLVDDPMEDGAEPAKRRMLLAAKGLCRAAMMASGSTIAGSSSLPGKNNMLTAA